MQCRWKTVQQVVQDHIFEFLWTSDVHIAHSYCRLSMSSWSLVAKSAAVDLEGRLLLGKLLWAAIADGTLAEPFADTKFGASALSPDSGFISPTAESISSARVNCPPKVRPPAISRFATVCCGPFPRPLLVPLPRFAGVFMRCILGSACPPPREGGGVAVGEGTEIGRRVGGGGLDAASAPLVCVLCCGLDGRVCLL